MESENQSNLLGKIFRVFLEVPDRPLNFSQICESLKGDNKISALRKEVKGAFEILEFLGVIRCVYNRPTTKLFQLCDPIPISSIGKKIEETYSNTKKNFPNSI
jgi:hypothetical protein